MNFFRALNARPLEEQQYSDGMLHWRADETHCPKGKILVCAEPGAGGGRSIFEWAAHQGAQVILLNRVLTDMTWLARTATQVDYLIVDADFMDDIEDAVDLCLRIRRGLPGLRIILISGEVRGHDLTCERMNACDVTLKGPVTARCLDLGAHVARESHGKFMNQRCARPG